MQMHPFGIDTWCINIKQLFHAVESNQPNDGKLAMSKIDCLKNTMKNVRE